MEGGEGGRGGRDITWEEGFLWCGVYSMGSVGGKYPWNVGHPVMVDHSGSETGNSDITAAAVYRDFRTGAGDL